MHDGKAVPLAMQEKVDDASIEHSWLLLFFQLRPCRFGIALGLAEVFGEGQGRAEPVSKNLCAARSDAPTSGICLLLELLFCLCQRCSMRSI